MKKTTDRAGATQVGAMIKVLCVDDHRIVRDGLTMILEHQPDITVVGTAATGSEAIAAFERLHPDITLMDLQLGSISGTQAIYTIKQRHPEARIIVLTMHTGDEDIHRAMSAGATTYLVKDTLTEDLVRIIREVHSGRFPVQPHIQVKLEQRAATHVLTSREVEVMELVAQGLTNKEIATALGISCETAHVHVRHILAKLNVTNQRAAVKEALRRGIVHMEY
jgi:DNA-binding NarL/FixJ family response regulator